MRFLYLSIFVVALLTSLMCLSYTNRNQNRTNSPIKNLVTYDGLFQTNASPVERKSNAVVPVYNNNASPKESQQQEFGSTLATHASTNSTQPDLLRGVVAKIIYQAGHFEVINKVCPDMGSSIKILIIITSAPSHENARLAIRETWGQFALQRDITIAFMLGSTTNETLNKRIEQEQNLQYDIIRGKFIDTYDNLTLKTISLLEWVDNNCPKADFVLKTDDDIFINVPHLMIFLAKRKPDQRAIYGRIARKWKPIRIKKSKYYISSQQYKPRVFPDFTTGPAYLFPAQLCRELYTAALNHTYFKLEDVFITGIVADELKIKRVHAPGFFNKKVALSSFYLRKGIIFHKIKISEQYDLWKATSSRHKVLSILVDSNIFKLRLITSASNSS